MATSAKEIQLREAKETISMLNATVSTLTATIASLNNELARKNEAEKNAQERLAVLQEQVDYLTKKLFGTSSEKRSSDVPGQYHLFNEAEEIQETESSESHEEETVVKEHTRKKKAKAEDTFKGLKVNKVVIPLPKDEQICSYCGTQMELIGEEYVRRELIFIPARCEINEIYTQTYGCPKCKDGSGINEKPVIVKSKAPEGLVGKGPATASSVAWCIYQKYVNSIPLFRQEKDWVQYGAAISRTTLANWIITCAEKYFQPLYDYFHRELIKRHFAMADETRTQVLHEPERSPESQSFMWLFRSGEDGLPIIILYSYTSTRNGDHAAEFLKGFCGYLETDGYPGYNKVPDIKRCSCWAHIRRYLIDAIPKGKQFDYSQPAVQGVQYCDRLFRIEDDINKRYPGDYEKRKQIRLEKEKPILEAFWSWLDNQHPIRNSRMAKAVTYIQNRRSTANTYLEDGRCSFTNNLSENAIRPFTLGRKNWLFSSTVDGAEASAVVYSIVEMAKAHNLKVFDYLQYVLEQRPDKTWSDERLDELAPWSEKLQHLKTRM